MKVMNDVEDTGIPNKAFQAKEFLLEMEDHQIAVKLYQIKTKLR